MRRRFIEPDLGGLGTDDLAGDLLKEWVATVVEVGEAHADGLIVMCSHRREKVRIDRVRAGVRGLGEAPADRTADHADDDDDHDQLPADGAPPIAIRERRFAGVA